MKGFGVQAVYKCVTKGLTYHHFVDYLAIALSQIQTWELCYLAVTPDKKPKRGTVTDAQLESSTMKLKRIFELTAPQQSSTQQNLYERTSARDSGNSQIATDFDFNRFKDELVSLAELERLTSEAPLVPQITPLEEVTLQKNMAWTVRTRMTKFYQRHTVSDALLQRLEEFIEKNLACATCDL